MNPKKAFVSHKTYNTAQASSTVGGSRREGDKMLGTSQTAQYWMNDITEVGPTPQGLRPVGLFDDGNLGNDSISQGVVQRIFDESQTKAAISLAAPPSSPPTARPGTTRSPHGSPSEAHPTASRRQRRKFIPSTSPRPPLPPRAELLQFVAADPSSLSPAPSYLPSPRSVLAAEAALSQRVRQHNAKLSEFNDWEIESDEEVHITQEQQASDETVDEGRGSVRPGSEHGGNHPLNRKRKRYSRQADTKDGEYSPTETGTDSSGESEQSDESDEKHTNTEHADERPPTGSTERLTSEEILRSEATPSVRNTELTTSGVEISRHSTPLAVASWPVPVLDPGEGCFYTHDSHDGKVGVFATDYDPQLTIPPGSLSPQDAIYDVRQSIACHGFPVLVVLYGNEPAGYISPADQKFELLCRLLHGKHQIQLKLKWDYKESIHNSTLSRYVGSGNWAALCNRGDAGSVVVPWIPRVVYAPPSSVTHARADMNRQETTPFEAFADEPTSSVSRELRKMAEEENLRR
ncbi:hypothetical protein BJ508DRAFT_316145 [Ascobolus immersus RN42]|uniref:Uncharacterized protein n=1 Tax=Ascobolus immersus RN42 TaxID=1160509 RepID=A0A3N4HBV1_ASCIM|nr:hypothetical protein BJ508DRAFT_316145 [Ascobolus immersus RN42]